MHYLYLWSEFDKWGCVTVLYKPHYFELEQYRWFEIKIKLVFLVTTLLLIYANGNEKKDI